MRQTARRAELRDWGWEVTESRKAELRAEVERIKSEPFNRDMDRAFQRLFAIADELLGTPNAELSAVEQAAIDKLLERSMWEAFQGALRAAPDVSVWDERDAFRVWHAARQHRLERDTAERVKILNAPQITRAH